MRRTLTATVAVVAASAAVPATAQADRSDCPKRLERSYSKHYAKVARVHGTRAPGRDIRKWGVRFRGIVFDATCGELGRSRHQLRQLLRAPAYAHSEAVPPPQPPASVQSDRTVANGGTSNSMVNPACESGGNPHINTGNGYYGKYQFDISTWQAHGGPPGLPSDHPEWVQDQVAARVQYDAWPNC